MTVIPFDRDRRPVLDTGAHDRWVEWLAERLGHAGANLDLDAIRDVLDEALDVPSNLVQWTGEDIAAEVIRIATGRFAKAGNMVAVVKVRTLAASRGVRL